MQEHSHRALGGRSRCSYLWTIAMAVLLACELGKDVESACTLTLQGARAARAAAKRGVERATMHTKKSIAKSRPDIYRTTKRHA
jgi:hypothetical protein